MINENDLKIGAIGAIVTAIVLPNTVTLGGNLFEQAGLNIAASLTVGLAFVFVAHLLGLTK